MKSSLDPKVLWPGSDLLSVTDFRSQDGRLQREVTLIQPIDFLHPIRVERIFDADQQLVASSEMVANRVIVRVAEGKLERFQQLVSAMNAEARQISSLGMYTVTLPRVTADAAIEAIEYLNEFQHLITYAEPDGIVRISAEPNDPEYVNGALWGLHNTGQSGEVFNRNETEIVSGTVDADIDAVEGWDIRTDAPNAIIGVIDTGVRYTHEDLAPNMWINPGEDGLDAFGNSKRTNGLDDDENGWVDDVFGIDAVNNDGDPIDDNGHGTHVSGTVAAVGNNGKGVVGVAWDAQIMALKFLVESGGGSSSDAIICLDYAIQNGATLTNNSWGGGLRNQALVDMIAAADQAGQLFIAAAGNASSDIDVVNIYPASYQLPNIITVAATDRRDIPASFTNTGSGTVDIAAPGDTILSLTHENDSGVTVKSGTSMAAPAVSGLVALVHEQFPSSDHIAVKNRVLASRRSVASLNSRVITGGMIHVLDALQTSSDGPFHDAFANAHLIQEDPEVIRTSNIHATSEPGEPLHAALGVHSVWFKVEPENPARLRFSTEGSDFDTVMAVYSGAAVDALTEIEINDDTEGQSYSSLQIDVSAGETYYIAVAGKNGEEGLLMMSMSGPPSSDSLENAIPIETLPFFELADNSLATEEPNEPDHANAGGDRSIWYRLELSSFGESSREVVLSTLGSEFDSVLAVYTSPVSEPEVDDLVLLLENDDAPYGDTYSELSFLAEANETYWIVVDSKLNGGQGSMRLLGHPKTLQDDFEDAIGIFGDRSSISFTATDFERATREFGEPNHDNAGGTGSLWYKWSPDTDGDYRIETNSPTAMGIYVGDSVDSLNLVAGDQSEGSASLAILESAVSTTEYFIAIDNRGSAGTSNDITLAIKPFTVVENDGWKNAEPVPVTPTTEAPVLIAVKNENGSREPNEPGASVQASVWYTWVASETATYRIDAVGNVDLDTELAVYSVGPTPSGFGDFTWIAGDSDSGVWTNALVTFPAVAGTTYYIQAGTADAGQAGEFELNFYPYVLPANDDLANAEDVSSFFVQREVSYHGASREPDEPQHATNNAAWDTGAFTTLPESPTAYYTLWYRWSPADASEARRTAASSFGSGAETIVAVYETTVANPSYTDLTPVAAPNGQWGDLWSWGEVTWDAELGKTYYVMCGNQSSALDDELYRISITQNPNDSSAGAVILPSEKNVSYQDSNFATNTYSPHVDTGQRALWYEWTVPEDGVYTVDTYGSRLQTTQTAIGADTTGQGDGGRVKLVLQEKVAPGVYVPFGSYFGFFVSDTDYNTLMAFQATAGTTLAFVVDSTLPDSISVSSGEHAYAYRAVVQLNITSGAPENDDFEQAKEIEGSFYHELVDLKHASFQTGEPEHAGNSSKSLWWKWSAPDTGLYYVTSAGDIFDSQIAGNQAVAVYEGPAQGAAFNDLTQLTEHTRSGARYYPANTSFNAVVGQTYYIAVAAAPGGQGFGGFKTGMMLSRKASNDDFADAEEITGSIRTVYGHNAGSGLELDEPQIDPGDTDSEQKSVWWKWVAPASGFTTISTRSSYLNNEVGVYTGSTLSTLVPVVRDSPAGDFRDDPTYEARVATGTSFLSFSANQGETYYVNVSGFMNITGAGSGNSFGPIVLELTGQPGVPLDPTDLMATRLSTTRVDVTWMDQAVDETHYTVERASSESGPWQEVYRSADADIESWSDLAADADYYYRVRAEGRGGVSNWVVLPPFEFMVTAIETDVGEVRLTWVDAAIETSYRVSLRLQGTTDWVIIEPSLAPDSVSFDLVTLVPEREYEFRVEGLIGTSGFYEDSVLFLLGPGSPDPLTALQAWRQLHFGTAADRGIAANTASLLNDGITNFAKFAFGGTPYTGAADLKPTGALDHSGAESYFEITYRRREGSGSGTTETGYTVDGVTYIVEVKPDLVSGTWETGVALLEEQAISPNGDGTQSVTVRCKEPIRNKDRLFMRLRLE